MGSAVSSWSETSGPVRVLLVADKLGFKDVKLHGTGRLIIEWTRAFDPARVQLTTCVLRHPGPFADELAQAGIHIRFLGDGRFNPGTLGKLVHLIREYGIEVLHVQGFGGSTLGRIAARLTGRPVVMHIHSNAVDDPAGYPFYVRAMDRMLAPWTSRALAVSASTRGFAIEQMGFRPEQVEVVHNPLPDLDYHRASASELAALRQTYGFDEGARIIGITSRLYPVKGHRVLLDAFAGLASTHPVARLLIVGDGPERAALEARAHQLGIADRTCFAGFQEDVATHLRLCNVTVVPSVHPEPFGMVVLESMAAGVPVVASRTGGLAEIFEDGTAGFLVPAGDARALQSAITRILDNPDLRQRMSVQSIRESGRFSMAEFLRRMEQLYRELADRPAQAHTN